MAAASSVEENRAKNRIVEGRTVCERCRRPTNGCYCARLPSIPTRSRLVVLQHPRERYVAIGTAYMASLCLPSSELHIGTDWDESPTLARALSDPERPPILLYPGEDAIDIVERPPASPVTLVVVDGTWALTKKVVRRSRVLAGLPRYAFTPERPSEYRIRREPTAASVATIEAIATVLGVLEAGEGDPERFQALLDPFRAMVDFQIECKERFHGGRSRHASHRARPRRRRVPRIITERFSDLVCISAEANAWPSTIRMQNPAYYEDELVHLAAHRPATNETLSLIAAPRRALAPGTMPHTGIDEATLRRGMSLGELHRTWRAFIRPTDVVCSWGRYEPELFVRSEGWLPDRLDLRHVAKMFGKTRNLEGQMAGVPGRAGKKLHSLVELITRLTTLPDT